MVKTYHTQLRSWSAYIIASWDVVRAPMPDELSPGECLIAPVSAELFDAASVVLCDYQGRLMTVRELLDQLSAQILIGPEKTAEDLEHDYVKHVVSVAQSLGPISREALLYVARYAVDSLDEPDEVDADVYLTDDDEFLSVMRAQWNRLSPGEQALEWHRCEELCAQGLGDQHWFYPILMPQIRVGYVGD